jgi:hypothetical protein
MEILLGLIATGVFSFLAGFMIAGFLKIDIKFSKKEDYAAKVKMFEGLIEDLQHKLDEAQVQEPNTPSYRPDDFFPPNLYRDYGVPKKLDE